MSPIEMSSIDLPPLGIVIGRSVRTNREPVPFVWTMKMTDESHELTESYYRCRQDEAFLDTFYDLFLAKSSVIAELFSQTDFSRQKLMLRQSLLEVILF